MKFSKYIQFIKHEDNDKEVLFAYRQNEIIDLDKRLASLIRTNIDTPDNIRDIHPELYNCLAERQIIIPDECDETILCLNEINQKLSSDQTVRLTINPTMDCNLRCWYCYENHMTGSVMDKSMIRQVCDYIRKAAESPTMENLILSFFGGEPLLRYNSVVKPIIISACDSCKRNGKAILVSFTSNGVCLTRHIVDDLTETVNNVSVQIAFDGGKSTHNNVKKFANGDGTYDLVVSNLKYAINKGIFTTIRCNYTATNLISFAELVEDFIDLHENKNLKFSFHRVWQEKDSELLTKHMSEFKTIAKQFRFSSNLSSHAVVNLSPCYADYLNSVVINYNGDIFRCTARDFKKSNRIGILKNGTIVFDDAQSSESSPRRFYKECGECKMLPICNICYQQRKDSPGICPQGEISNEDISANIDKYYSDLTNTSNQSYS